MALIKVNTAFYYAISGNFVVEYKPGVHEVTPEVAKTAIDELKVAEETKDKKDLLPAITRDIDGNLLPGAVEESK